MDITISARDGVSGNSLRASTDSTGRVWLKITRDTTKKPPQPSDDPAGVVLSRETWDVFCQLVEKLTDARAVK